MSAQHLVSLLDWSSRDIERIVDSALSIKAQPKRYADCLASKTLGLIFQKPSTRTRVSFQVAMYQMGGHVVVLNQGEMQLGRGESVPDTARVLSRYVDGIAARVFGHRDIEALAAYASVPVINALSDRLHPCQALADYLTIKEHFGGIRDVPITYVGDGNNVIHSLAAAAARLGGKLTICTPQGYEPDSSVMAKANEAANGTGAVLRAVIDPREAVCGAKVVYTDVWTSMGQEEEHPRRLRDFAGYQIDDKLFGLADSDAIFMHCLPAHRGEEVTDEIVDHERSLVFDQAENRLHAQKAVLLQLISLDH